MKQPVLIALDGPVGAGKSSLADAVAHRLNILHLDTGAMYRALALGALKLGVDVQDEASLTRLCDDGAVHVDVQFAKGRQQTLLNGVPVDDDIRSQEIGSAASTVSRYRRVRQYLVERQQQLAAQQSMIVDGRDIGTVVLPMARAKIFLTASAEKRAQRRYQQLLDKGQKTDYQAVLDELRQRDRQDSERVVDPLRQADDAVLLDTSDLDFDQSVQAILRIVEAAYAG
ncbi:MAG: (d)CMP kinase [Clostridiales bacterium]|nr:(d)CMP kinase [Clostridiales bacterium]